MSEEAKENLVLENKILGCIYGNCIGDAIGLLTEFMTKKEAAQVYGKIRHDLQYTDKVSDKHRDVFRTGDWTDDSDQMILIMDSIIHCQAETQAGKVNVQDYAERIKTWGSSGFPELGDTFGSGLGHTTNMVLRHQCFDSDPHWAARDVWERTGRFVAPNGAVMRTAVLGIYNHHNLKQVQQNCKDIAKVTHADPRCLASCVAVCSAVVFMLKGDERHLKFDAKYQENIIDGDKVTEDSYEEAAKVFKEDEELDEQEKKVYCDELKEYMFEEDLTKLKLDEPGKIGYTYKSLGAGFWALRQSRFKDALTEIVMEAGDADTNGAVAGALLGCKVGFQHLPSIWSDNLCYKQWLDNRIYKFMEKAVPELKMQWIQYDENYTPTILPTPKQSKRVRKLKKEPPPMSNQVTADKNNRQGSSHDEHIDKISSLTPDKTEQEEEMDQECKRKDEQNSKAESKMEAETDEGESKVGGASSGGAHVEGDTGGHQVTEDRGESRSPGAQGGSLTSAETQKADVSQTGGHWVTDDRGESKSPSVQRVGDTQKGRHRVTDSQQEQKQDVEGASSANNTRRKEDHASGKDNSEPNGCMNKISEPKVL